MGEEFEQIELYEKDGIGKMLVNGRKVKGMTGYNLKRSTDMIDITINISVPVSNFKTIEN